VDALHRLGPGCHPHDRRHNPDRFERRIPPFHVFARHGIPFLLLALVYARAGRTLGILRHHGPAVERAGGALLVAVGVLLVTGVWQSLFTPWPGSS